MLQVENKLELFEDVVYKRRLLELEKRKEAWEEEKSHLIARKRKQWQEEQAHIIQRRENLAQVMGNEKIAKARENERVLGLKKINELKKDFLVAIEDRVASYAETDEYRKHFVEGVLMSLKEMAPGEYRIGMVKRDRDAFFAEVEEKAKKEGFVLHPYLLEERAIGGHCITDMEKTYSLNYDLHTKIYDKRYEIGKLLYRLFKEEMDHA